MYKKMLTVKHPTKILNILPNDYNHDGRLDILVMSQDSGRNETTMSLYYSTAPGVFGWVIQSDLVAAL